MPWKSNKMWVNSRAVFASIKLLLRIGFMMVLMSLKRIRAYVRLTAFRKLAPENSFRVVRTFMSAKVRTGGVVFPADLAGVKISFLCNTHWPQSFCFNVFSCKMVIRGQDIGSSKIWTWLSSLQVEVKVFVDLLRFKLVKQTQIFDSYYTYILIFLKRNIVII